MFFSVVAFPVILTDLSNGWIHVSFCVVQFVWTCD